jgi:ferric-dicitrate binding protein FerR (iron transport regulator)
MIALKMFPKRQRRRQAAVGLVLVVMLILAIALMVWARGQCNGSTQRTITGYSAIDKLIQRR